jgi:hypothetical protein
VTNGHRSTSLAQPSATGSPERRADSSLLIPLRLIGGATDPIELVHPRGHVLRLPGSFDAGSLARILRLLDQREEG